MARLLYVTPQAPSLRTGGGRHCYANLRALCGTPGTDVSYVGPPIDEQLEGLEGLSQLVARPYVRRDKLHAAVTGAATSLVGLFRDWRRNGPREFDLGFFETTKLGFAISHFAGHLKTVCSVHNVETDFMQGARGFSRLAAHNARRSEHEVLRRCDHLLVMHEHDLARLKRVYGMPALDARASLHPVCAVPSLEPLPYESRKRRIVIPGSLDQAYNESGIRAFLTECGPSLKDLNVELVVAGRNPRPVLRNSVHHAGGILIENPASMAEIVRDARIVLVPDMGGAGMKLRVAEALSLGVPVVGTREALLGYVEANEFGRVVASISELTGSIREIMQNPALGGALARRAREVWDARYSFDAFSFRIRGWLPTWLG